MAYIPPSLTVSHETHSEELLDISHGKNYIKDTSTQYTHLMNYITITHWDITHSARSVLNVTTTDLDSQVARLYQLWVKDNLADIPEDEEASWLLEANEQFPCNLTVTPTSYPGTRTNVLSRV